MQNNFVSSAKSNLYDLFVQPYFDGAENLKQATRGLKSIVEHRIFKKNVENVPALNLKERVKHFALGIGLVIPVVNTVVYVVHRHFSKKGTKSSDSKIESLKKNIESAKEKSVRFCEVRVREFNKNEAPIVVANVKSYTASLNGSLNSLRNDASRFLKNVKAKLASLCSKS